MNKKAVIVVAILLLLGAGYATYAYMTRPVAPPSQPVSGMQPPTGTSTESGTNATTTDPNTYSIKQDGSHVNFILDEILRGSPYTVVGTSTEVGGEIIVDRTKLQEAKIGTIRINARTIKTDDERRNGMMGRFILKSEDPQYEFITFETTEVTGLPASATIGDPLHFAISGNLTIAGITKPATFDAHAVFMDDTTLTADASTVVKRSDYNLTIPDIPFVANVTDDVTLKIQLTAVK